MAQTLRWRELFQGSRGKLTAGILLVEFLVAVEALVVVAIMPAVRRDLGGLEYYGLVFTGFSLAALVASPIGGRSADRRGPARPFLAFAAVFIAGTVLCGLAPTMPALVLTRVLQGLGAGGAYTVALTALTRSYDDAGRARVLALLAGAWIIPGLLGPSYGALLAGSIGWRWAFFSILPLIVVAIALAFPGLRAIKPAARSDATSPRRWPPPAGMPAAILTIFFLIFAFIGAEYFIPLMLTAVRGRSLTEAGIVVTLGTVSWSAGNWWQSRAVNRISARSLGRVGAAILALAIVGIILSLADLPLRSRSVGRSAELPSRWPLPCTLLSSRASSVPWFSHLPPRWRRLRSHRDSAGTATSLNVRFPLARSGNGGHNRVCDQPAARRRTLLPGG
ncbi:MAG: MFS transporter [Chloroflexi bacterium]|nr:MAG: MFS transporter [Chloroflexota bacterium]